MASSTSFGAIRSSICLLFFLCFAENSALAHILPPFSSDFYKCSLPTPLAHRLPTQYAVTDDPIHWGNTSSRLHPRPWLRAPDAHTWKDVSIEQRTCSSGHPSGHHLRAAKSPFGLLTQIGEGALLGSGFSSLPTLLLLRPRGGNPILETLVTLRTGTNPILCCFLDFDGGYTKDLHGGSLLHRFLHRTPSSSR